MVLKQRASSPTSRSLLHEYAFCRFMHIKGSLSYYLSASRHCSPDPACPSCALLPSSLQSRKTKGLPIAKKGTQPDLDNLRFHVRVLIPCYKESVDLVRKTVLGALNAALPKDTIRTVYLCDDGKDPAKEAMVRELNAEYGCLDYISGRKRDPNGELPVMGWGAAGWGRAGVLLLLDNEFCLRAGSWTGAI